MTSNINTGFETPPLFPPDVLVSLERKRCAFRESLAPHASPLLPLWSAGGRRNGMGGANPLFEKWPRDDNPRGAANPAAPEMQQHAKRANHTGIRAHTPRGPTMAGPHRAQTGPMTGDPRVFQARHSLADSCRFPYILIKRGSFSRSHFPPRKPVRQVCERGSEQTMAAPAEACAIPFIVEDCDSEGVLRTLAKPMANCLASSPGSKPDAHKTCPDKFDFAHGLV